MENFKITFHTPSTNAERPATVSVYSERDVGGDISGCEGVGLEVLKCGCDDIDVIQCCCEGGGKVDDGWRCWFGLEVKVGHDAEAVSCSTHGEEDVWIVDLRCVDLSTIGEDNIKCDDMVKSEAPFSRTVTVATMQSVTSNSNSRACAVGKSTLSLVVEGQSHVSKSLPRSNFSNECSLFRSAS